MNAGVFWILCIYAVIYAKGMLVDQIRDKSYSISQCLNSSEAFREFGQMKINHKKNPDTNSITEFFKEKLIIYEYLLGS